MPGLIRITLHRESEPNKGLVELRGPQGESAICQFNLPWWDKVEWQAVFLSLELHEEDSKTWPQSKIREKAEELGLFLRQENRPSSDRFKIIGQALYKAVFSSEEIRTLLDRLLHAESEPVVEFHIHDEDGLLQTYPWELLCDDKEFLFEGKRAFPVRHVDFEEPVTPFELTGVLRILYIAPRPDLSSYQRYTDLPVLERLPLEYLKYYYPDYLTLESLSENMLNALQKRLVRSKDPVHVVHIDTHGGFGWLCQCKWLNPADTKQCSKCSHDQSSDQRSRGYLAFETTDADIDWINGDDLGKRLSGRAVQVVILSACRSGLVGEGSTFNSVAGALIKQGIPAVVGMQFNIEVKQALKFAEMFYWALLDGKTLTEAVAEARIALSRDSWYRPVLYLRTDSSNYRGKIFEPKSSLGPPPKLTPREKWVARLGFKRDPFLYTDGGNDPYLQEYFYRMKYFYDILGDVSRPGTVFVFGPPGSGKSSLRNVIKQTCPPDNILPVVYQDFGSLVRKYQEEKAVQTEDHVAQILRVALRTLAGLEKLTETSSPETEKTRIIRNQLWLYVSQFEDDPLIKQTLADLLKPDPEVNGTLPTNTRDRLSRFCRYVTELFRYRFVYILVDPDDSISADIAWQVLKPLLSARSLLELSEDKVAFKFFLRQDFQNWALKIAWIDQEWSRRVYNLDWPPEELHNLLKVRLGECSKKRYKSLGQLSDVSDLDEKVIRLSRGSPRDLVAMCNELFSEHSHGWSPETGEPLLITAQEVNKVLQPFEERHRESTLAKLIAQGESDKIEFKSTMRYNRKAKKRDEEMDKEVARTICAFMNTEGGTLLIGVDDDGAVLGLDDDFSTLGGANPRDAFRRAFENITKDLFSSPLSPDYYKARFEEYQGKVIYVVEVLRSKEPVYCKFGEEKEFYVRKQTISQKLDIETAVKYIREHFGI